MNRKTANDVKALKVVSHALHAVQDAARSTLEAFGTIQDTRTLIHDADKKAWEAAHAAADSVYGALVAVDAVKKVYSAEHINAELEQAIIKTNRMYNSISDITETVDELTNVTNSATKASLRNMVYQKANLAQKQAGEITMLWQKLVDNTPHRGQEAGRRTRRTKKSRRSYRSRRR